MLARGANFENMDDVSRWLCDESVVLEDERNSWYAKTSGKVPREGGDRQEPVVVAG
jgi:hypothetical protein